MKDYKRLTDKKVEGTTERYIRVDKDYILSAYDIIDEERQDFVEMIINRLAELEDKIENGTLIELPCKVGDTVWDIVKSINRTKNTIVYKHIQEYQVERIEIDNYNLYLVITVFTEDGICEGYARPNQVYYTKAEAEKKFKELKGK